MGEFDHPVFREAMGIYHSARDAYEHGIMSMPYRKDAGKLVDISDKLAAALQGIKQHVQMVKDAADLPADQRDNLVTIMSGYLGNVKDWQKKAQTYLKELKTKSPAARS